MDRAGSYPPELIRELVDLRPAAIISRLDLRRPIYQPTAAYGHFGRPELDLPWERLNLVDQLRAAAGLPALGERESVPLLAG